MDALHEQINTIVIGALKQGLRIEDILAVLSAQEHQLRNALPIVKAIQHQENNPC
jgi:hypothetical protein